jgi:hypothetical protein
VLGLLGGVVLGAGVLGDEGHGGVVDALAHRLDVLGARDDGHRGDAVPEVGEGDAALAAGLAAAGGGVGVVALDQAAQAGAEPGDGVGLREGQRLGGDRGQDGGVGDGEGLLVQGVAVPEGDVAGGERGDEVGELLHQAPVGADQELGLVLRAPERQAELVPGGALVHRLEGVAVAVGEVHDVADGLAVQEARHPARGHQPHQAAGLVEFDVAHAGQLPQVVPARLAIEHPRQPIDRPLVLQLGADAVPLGLHERHRRPRRGGGHIDVAEIHGQMLIEHMYERKRSGQEFSHPLRRMKSRCFSRRATGGDVRSRRLPA